MNSYKKKLINIFMFFYRKKRKILILDHKNISMFDHKKSSIFNTCIIMIVNCLFFLSKLIFLFSFIYLSNLSFLLKILIIFLFLTNSISFLFNVFFCIFLNYDITIMILTSVHSLTEIYAVGILLLILYWYAILISFFYIFYMVYSLFKK